MKCKNRNIEERLKSIMNGSFMSYLVELGCDREGTGILLSFEVDIQEDNYAQF